MKTRMPDIHSQFTLSHILHLLFFGNESEFLLSGGFPIPHKSKRTISSTASFLQFRGIFGVKPFVEGGCEVSFDLQKRC